MRTLFLAAVLVTAVAAAEAGSTLQPPETDQRIHLCQDRLHNNPDDLRTTEELIVLYLQKIRETADVRYLDLASGLLQKMLEKDGGSLDALRLENEIDLQRHDFKSVQARSNDLLQYNRSDPAIWGNLGDASMELGEYDHAREAFLQMFALRPNLASYNRLGYWYFVTGNVNAAVAFMRQAIDAGSATPENTAWCWAELGDIYFKTGAVDDARKSYETALALFPSLHRAWAGLGKIDAERGNIHAAIKSYKHAQAIVPMIEYAGALEDLFTVAGMPKEAAAQRDLANAIYQLGVSRKEKTNRNLALLFADHNRSLDVALSMIQAEIPDRPDVYTYDALSWVLFKTGHLAEADDASRQALRLKTPEPVFYYHAAAIARALGDVNAAAAYDKQLASLNPNFNGAASARNISLLVRGSK